MIKITNFFLLVLCIATALLFAVSSFASAEMKKNNNKNRRPPLLQRQHPQHFKKQQQQQQNRLKKSSSSSSSASSPESVCMGEFQQCPTGECSLTKTACNGICPPGYYVCPTNPQNTSAPQGCAKKFSQCPNLKGTFWDWTLSTEQRLDILASLVSIDDQSKQLTNFAPSIDALYIPEYQWLNDDLHGARGNWTTSFPDGCGLGATWDKELLHDVGYTISREAREIHHFYTSRGVRGVSDPVLNGIGLTAYAPNVNLQVHTRWGRAQEVYSEDPVLTKVLSTSYIKGMQFSQVSNITGKKYLQGIACAKHFLAYDVEDFPIDRYHYDAIVNGRNLFETYLPAFFDAIYNGDVKSIMPSYNSINGVPTACAGDYMNFLAREKWNFTGFFVSDYDAWFNIFATHAYVPTIAAAAAIGINNGMDQEGGGWTAISYLPQCVSQGTVQAATITTSFRRLFRARMELGMFDPPEFLEFFSNLNSADVGDDKHEHLALRAALESATLLRNADGNTIPLPVTEGSDFTLVVGPKAASTTWVEGNYATKPTAGTISALEGIVNFVCPWDNGWDTKLYYGFSVFATAEWTQQYKPVADVASINDCQSLCENNLRCNFFTYISKEKECYLLPVQGPMTPNANAVSGARHGLVVVQHSVSYAAPGVVPPSIAARDSRECCQRCRVNATCAWFTFDGEIGRCFLFTNASSTQYPASSSAIVSGLSPVKCPGVKYVEMCEESDLHCTLPTTVPEAVALAGKATQTIVLFGLDQSFESEGHDRRTIDLPAVWYSIFTQLRQATTNAGTSLIGVMIHGGAFRIDLIQFDAVIDMMYPGQQGGRAIGQVLFGGYAPAGRTTSTWYQSDSDLPPNLGYQNLYPNATSGFLGVTYRYFSGTPSIPFGFGLTLAQMQYSDLEIYPNVVTGCEIINVSFTVTCVGGLFQGYSDEVAQVYIRQAGSASQPVPQVRLVNFTRVRSVPTGAGVRVTLSINPRDRTVIFQNDEKPHLSTEMLVDGGFNVYVGGGQPDYYANGLEGRVSVNMGSPMNVDGCNTPRFKNF